MSVVGNRNASRHGLTAGQLPKGCGWVKRSVDEFRRLAEDAVIARHGSITLHRACLVNSACKWERHSLLALRWLRLQMDSLTPDQKLTFSREIARASTERDRCIAQLGLDRADAAAIIAGLYGEIPTPDQLIPNTDAETGPTTADSPANAPPAQPARRHATRKTSRSQREVDFKEEPNDF